MSDPTSDERNTTPETDAPTAAYARSETDPTDQSAPGEPAHAAAAVPADESAPVPLAEPAASAPVAPVVVPEPVGEPISYETPAAVSAEAAHEDAQVATQDRTAAEHAPVTDYTPGYTPAVPVQAPAGPIYIQAPAPPVDKGNRGAGVLLVLLATVIYAIVYALVAFGIAGAGSGSVADAAAKFTDFIVLPVFYVPAVFFFIGFSLLVLIVNRGGWWAYVLFGFLVAVIVYFSYIGAALLTVQAWNFTPSEAVRFITAQWLSPYAIAAAVVAREVPIWFGAWIARRGRTVTARNAAARQDYDRRLAEGPQLSRPQ
ncbi:hypothetical protein QN357_04220 [Cryobacterium sp. RTC2.1]|uniref:hypothetical protein n=1 Tax=Cryobacterium sp. RTC2.1 TaxID=3048634 RepID=UPI002B23573A|nr:hypothetical protein [Cryobacterium sp. RTC2.1]MEB0002145.1 hypothetical protein [Cryobacterium sp. RTC2.1]